MTLLLRFWKPIAIVLLLTGLYMAGRYHQHRSDALALSEARSALKAEQACAAGSECAKRLLNESLESAKAVEAAKSAYEAQEQHRREIEQAEQKQRETEQAKKLASYARAAHDFEVRKQQQLATDKSCQAQRAEVMACLVQ